ncbi:MAG: hypothetical protein HOD92_11315 [Deltaproteobacteria bacterium]|jgi:hypothetical protein|nr:hypothetical protein [Deltaproteobacteria bacterium]MBT4526707.1 hypothetical protein [Deltaproteobacteria bacterium]
MKKRISLRIHRILKQVLDDVKEDFGYKNLSSFINNILSHSDKPYLDEKVKIDITVDEDIGKKVETEKTAFSGNPSDVINFHIAEYFKKNNFAKTITFKPEKWEGYFKHLNRKPQYKVKGLEVNVRPEGLELVGSIEKIEEYVCKNIVGEMKRNIVSESFVLEKYP